MVPARTGRSGIHSHGDWRRGREILLAQLRNSSVPLEGFLESLFQSAPQQVPGTAVFLTATPDATPHALLRSLKAMSEESMRWIAK